MAQHDMVIDNGPGLAVRRTSTPPSRRWCRPASGPVEPTVKYPGMLWLDTSVAPNGLVRQRNLANAAWIALTDQRDDAGRGYSRRAGKDGPGRRRRIPARRTATSTPTPWVRAKMTYANLKARSSARSVSISMARPPSRS